MKVHVPEMFTIPEYPSGYEDLFIRTLKHDIKDLNGIFLAGPCIREKHYGLFQNWRDTAIELFRKKDFQGDLFSPEPFCINGYDDQIVWEDIHLQQAKVILFWIPRELNIQPAFTSNVEFGEWMSSGKVILGYPKNACKMNYLQMKAEKYKIPCADTLELTVDLAITKYKELLAIAKYK